MDQVHVIRHKVLVEGRSQRQVAKEFGISRVTVRKYVEESAPVRKETGPRARPVWEKVGPKIEAVLAESGQWTGGKQQLTATRLHELLVAEGHQVGVMLVKEAVAEWKRRRREVFVPLTYRPGDLAEVDFFKVYVDIDGTRRKAWLFLMRLMYSGRDFAWIYARQDQVSFLEGLRILLGGERALTARFAALASHYLFEPCFCRPGEGHDKGGVEARGKALRRQPSRRFRARRRWKRSIRRCSRGWTRGSRRVVIRRRDDRHTVRRRNAAVSTAARALCRRGDDRRHRIAARAGAS